MRIGATSVANYDVKLAWKKSKQALDAMTPAERKQTLVRAVILTKPGNVARPYKGVFRSVQAK